MAWAAGRLAGGDAGGAEETGAAPLSKSRTRFANLIGAGAVMGFTPGQVWAMSLWEFSAAWAGWRAANCAPDGPSHPTLDQHAENLARASLL